MCDSYKPGSHLKLPKNMQQYKVKWSPTFYFIYTLLSTSLQYTQINTIAFKKVSE
jgi:hypothetical protein